MKPWDARLAARLVAPFVKSEHVHPNHFTLLRLVVGVAGGACFAFGESPNTAAVLVVLSNFLDHTDGELARSSGKSSRFGHYFDLVSDGIVTVGMFVGIGIGLSGSVLGAAAIWMGVAAGAAVAIMFQLRSAIENRHGKLAARQPRWAGFEAEDCLYLMPLVTLVDALQWFLMAAAIGAPVACLLVIAQYARMRRAPAGNLR